MVEGVSLHELAELPVGPRIGILDLLERLLEQGLLLEFLLELEDCPAGLVAEGGLLGLLLAAGLGAADHLEGHAPGGRVEVLPLGDSLPRSMHHFMERHSLVLLLTTFWYEIRAGLLSFFSRFYMLDQLTVPRKGEMELLRATQLRTIQYRGTTTSPYSSSLRRASASRISHPKQLTKMGVLLS